MNAQKMSSLLALIVLLIGCSTLVVAEDLWVAPEDRPTIVEISDTNVARLFRVQGLMEHISRYLSGIGFTRDVESLRIDIVQVLELLEGGGNEEDAVLPLLAEVSPALDADWLSSSQLREIGNVQDELLRLIETAVAALRRALAAGSADVARTELLGAAFIASSLTQSRDEEPTAPMTVAIHELLDLYPWHDAWVVEGESIQHAIDKLVDGGTIYIQQAGFRESLVINKSLTLSWAQVLPNGAFNFGGMDSGPTISAMPHRTVITVNGIGTEVLLSNISIAGGNVGILSGQGATVRAIEDCCMEITGSNVGILVMDDASVEFPGGIRYCDVGILVQDSGRLELGDASLGDNRISVVAEDDSTVAIDNVSLWRNSEAAIVIRDSAHAIVQSSTILMNQGDGIRLYDQAALHLSASRIYDNGGYGVRAMSSADDGDCDEIDISLLAISGVGNSIANSTSFEPNQLGAFCPAVLAEMPAAPTAED